MTIPRTLIVFLLILAAPVAYADALSKALADAKEECDGEGMGIFMESKEGQLIEAHARSQIAQAEQQEQAGNPRAAYATLRKISFCISGQSSDRIGKLQKRLENRLGHEDENNGRLKESFDWFRASENHPDIKPEERVHDDSERVMMKLAQAQPEDLPTFSTAFNYVKNPALKKTLRTLALKNAKQLLADEDKQFGAKQSEIYGRAFDSLEQARKWLEFAEAPENRMAAERAEKRGDSMASQTTPYYLKETIKYYDFAGKAEKIKTTQGRAKKLGDEAKSKGESDLAVDYYRIAGLSNEAYDLQKHAEAQQRKDEGKRQQKFKKDQDSLEKELGM